MNDIRVPPRVVISASDSVFMSAKTKSTPADRLIGEQIKSRRVAARLTDIDVAEHLSVSLETYVALEAGLMRPRARVLYTLAMLFHCRISTFFSAIPPCGISHSTENL